jgi:hypothetical protein
MKNETIDFGFEVKEVQEAGGFSGYLAVFGNIDEGGDIIEAGAFKKTLKEQKEFPLLWQHNSGEPLGKIVKAYEDEKGLMVEGILDLNVQAAREKHSLLRMGAIKGMSIGYRTIKEIWENSARKLKEIKLHEGSLCTFPMNQLATVTRVKAEDVQSILDAFIGMPIELKPYPDEHAARLQDPDGFDKFRRSKGGKVEGRDVPDSVSVIWGHVNGKGEDAWAAQALRFPVSNWTAEAARKWLKDNEVDPLAFEPASDKTADKIREVIEGLKALVGGMEPGKPTPMPDPEPQESKVDLSNLIQELNGFLNYTQGVA